MENDQIGGSDSSGCSQSRNRVDLDEIDKAFRLIAELDAMKLEEIRFHRSGSPVSVNEELFPEWRFVGMSNASFVRMYLTQ